MLRVGNTLRFTPDEIDAYRELGIDFAGARTQDDAEQALARWVSTLSGDRPDLLEKILGELAKAKGVTLPICCRRSCRLAKVLLVNPEPAVGNPVEVDQIVRLDFS